MKSNLILFLEKCTVLKKKKTIHCLFILFNFHLYKDAVLGRTGFQPAAHGCLRLYASKVHGKEMWQRSSGYIVVLYLLVFLICQLYVPLLYWECTEMRKQVSCRRTLPPAMCRCAGIGRFYSVEMLKGMEKVFLFQPFISYIPPLSRHCLVPTILRLQTVTVKLIECHLYHQLLSVTNKEL